MNILSELKWLYPGMKIKRWLLFLPVGLICVIIGTVFFINDYFNRILIYLGRITFINFGIDVSDKAQIYAVGSFFLFIGLVILYYVIRQVLNSVVYSITGTKTRLADQVYKRRFLIHGPRIVVIGGGTGLSTMLRGLKEYTSNITAIVTVSDDGGSSGRLRNEMGILPPGDIRNCLVALADTEESMETLLQYRFDCENMSGHSFGNLMLGALTEITGDFESAISKLSDILAIRGKVYPCAKESVNLVAKFEDGTVIEGETKISSYGKHIESIWLSNKDVKPSADALEAIKKADLIVLGPGSLYTSVIPNLLVSDIKEAVKHAHGTKIYVCNVMTQPGETDKYSAYDHFKVIKDYLDNCPIDYCFVNNVRPNEDILKVYEEQGQEYVDFDLKTFKKFSTKVVAGDFMQKGNNVRHDYKKLVQRIIRLVFYDKRRI